METIPISLFKAKCLKLLETVRNTGKPLLITKNGKPISIVEPPPKLPCKKKAFGAMKKSTKIIGDIVKPLGIDDWEVLK